MFKKLVLLCVCVVGAFSIANAQSRDDLQKQQQQIQKEINELNNELASIAVHPLV